jgi:hypothetical protein
MFQVTFFVMIPSVLRVLNKPVVKEMKLLFCVTLSNFEVKNISGVSWSNNKNWKVETRRPTKYK